jgi:hypothetical protein
MSNANNGFTYVTTSARPGDAPNVLLARNAAAL